MSERFIGAGVILSRPLKTLAESDQEMCDIYKSISEPSPNGIACPTCGAELLDKNRTKVLTIWPPRLETLCPSCGYEGTRVK